MLDNMYRTELRHKSKEISVTYRILPKGNMGSKSYDNNATCNIQHMDVPGKMDSPAFLPLQ